MIKSNYFSSDSSLSHYENGLLYDAYEQGQVLEFKPDPDLQFWKIIAEQSGKSILEIGCGTGRISTFLSDVGFDVTGLDNSKSMLDIAKQKSQSVNWVDGDMQNFQLNQKFDLIILAYNVFLHNLNNSVALQFLNFIKTLLNQHGKLVIDIVNPSYDFLRSRLESSRKVSSVFKHPDTDDIIIASRESQYQSDSQIFKIKYYYQVMGYQENPLHAIINFKLYFPQEIDGILGFAGYKINHKYGCYNFSDFTSDSPLQIMVCQAET